LSSTITRLLYEGKRSWKVVRREITSSRLGWIRGLILLTTLERSNLLVLIILYFPTFGTLYTYSTTRYNRKGADCTFNPTCSKSSSLQSRPIIKERHLNTSLLATPKNSPKRYTQAYSNSNSTKTPVLTSIIHETITQPSRLNHNPRTNAKPEWIKIAQDRHQERFYKLLVTIDSPASSPQSQDHASASFERPIPLLPHRIDSGFR